jgi:hypothetical protein
VDLIRQVFGELAHWQRTTGKRVRKFRAKSGQTYHDAIERFVGDLLRARAGDNGSGRIYRSIGKTSFEDDSVNYDVFIGKFLDDVAKWGNGHQSVADPIAHSRRPGGEEAGRPGRLSGRLNCERMTTNADK